MKRIYLFPNKLKLPALVVFVISLVLIILQFSEISIPLNMKVFAVVSDPFLDSENTGNFIWVEQDIYNEILDFLFFTSGIVLTFSKEKIEDEMIGFLRFKSLTYATYFAFSLLVISEFILYGMSFGYVIMFFFYCFVLFLNIFYYTKLFIYKKQFSHENED